MRRWWCLTALLSLTACGAEESAGQGVKGCIEPEPCVYVSPDPAKVKRPGTIYVFRGYGWRPNRMMGAGYGTYCPPPARACDDEGRGSEFRTDARGRFTFRLRHGRRLPADVPRPAGAGGGADSIQFVQWTGLPFESRRIARDAIPTPRPSTPAQRAQARAVAAAFARTARALDAAQPAIEASSARYDRALRQCRDVRPDQPAAGGVVSSLIGLAFEGALLHAVKPQLEALALDLERLDVEDPVLRAGTDAWIAAIRRPRPYPAPDLCTVLQRWAATGFDPAHAPLPPGSGDRLELMTELLVTPAVAAGAARLRALGAGRAAEDAFAGELLDVADLIGET